MWSAFFSWWQRRRPLRHLRFVVYTRRGCPLCADAWRLLRNEQRRYGFALQAVDINTDPQLANRYSEQVPVVTVNGRVRFWGRLNAALLKRLLYAESQRNPDNPA